MIEMCFAGWFVAPERSSSAKVTVCCLDERATSVFYAVVIFHGLYWTVSLHGCNLDRYSCSLLDTLPETLTSVSAVCLLLVALRSCRICEGNSDERFPKLSKLRNGWFMDASGYVMLLLYCKKSEFCSHDPHCNIIFSGTEIAKEEN